ncbi:TldD/PmbA family protein [bacterium]|nr:TldD/PmbA family protein [candidate division CSSED10-310 bacterium]
MKTMLESIIRRYNREVDYLEIRVEETEELSIGFKGPGVDMINQSSEKGGCVRALFKGGWGFATFNRIDETEISRFVQSAVRQSRLLGKEISRFAPVPVVDAVVGLKVKTDPRDIPLERKMDILSAYNQQILESDPCIRMSNVRYLDKAKHTWLATSDGSFVEQESIDIGGGLVAIAMKNGQTQMSSVGFGSSNDFNVVCGKEKDIEKACRHAAELLEAPPITGGVYTVVADPRLAGVFVHESFGHTSEGEKVFENESLAEVMKMGKQFGSPILNIYDTGLEPGYRGALVYDDEGVPAEKTVLIENGVLVGRLHSRETAGKMGEKATGNGRALDYKYPPIPRMRTTCIARGDADPGQMVREIELGVYAVDALGGQGGEMFSFTAGRAYMIRNGRIAEMVRNVTLSGNLFATLKNIDAVGNDFAVQDSGGGCGKGAQFPLPVSSGSPSIRIRNVVIAGK